MKQRMGRVCPIILKSTRYEFGDGGLSRRSKRSAKAGPRRPAKRLVMKGPSRSYSLSQRHSGPTPEAVSCAVRRRARCGGECDCGLAQHFARPSDQRWPLEIPVGRVRLVPAFLLRRPRGDVPVTTIAIGRDPQVGTLRHDLKANAPENLARQGQPLQLTQSQQLHGDRHRIRIRSGPHAL